MRWKSLRKMSEKGFSYVNRSDDKNGNGPGLGSKPYVSLDDVVSDGSLDPGESISVPLSFTVPVRLRFTFTLGVRGVL